MLSVRSDRCARLLPRFVSSYRLNCVRECGLNLPLAATVSPSDLTAQRPSCGLMRTAVLLSGAPNPLPPTIQTTHSLISVSWEDVKLIRTWDVLKLL